MKIYFLSSTPCALTLNGVFYGVTDKFERFAELSPADTIYACFAPEGALPVGFFITEALREAPPTGCEVYIVKDGLAVYAYDFPPVDLTLRPLDQKREGDLSATLFLQGKPQLCVESPEGMFNATLPPSFTKGELLFHRGYILVCNESKLAVFTKKAEPVLVEDILSFTLQKEGISATLPLSDRLGRTADCRWELTEAGCKLVSFALQEREDCPPEGLLAYAFFECALLQGDFAAFLCDELKKDAAAIRAFLGEFLSVTLIESPTVCGLVRKKADRLYAVDYIEVVIAEGKITDIRA